MKTSAKPKVKNGHNGPLIRGHTINVTQSIIDHSKQRRKATCMVAQAIKEQIDGAYSIKVTSDLICFNIGGNAHGNPYRADGEKGYRYSWKAPAKVGLYVELFDDRKEQIKPFKFVLDARQCLGAVPVRETGPIGPNRRKKKTKRTRRDGLRVCPHRRIHGRSALIGAHLDDSLS